MNGKKLTTLSQEQLLADAEALGGAAWKPPKVARPTDRGYKIVYTYWKEYIGRIGKPALIPNTRWMKAFFKMLATERPGALSEHLSEQTLISYSTRLGKAYWREHEVEIDEDSIKEVQDYILTELKDLFKLSNKARPKPIADSQDLDILLYYLWAEDQHLYRQERSRVQLALYLLILAFAAARPGAIVVSDAYRNSNEALKYEDLQFRFSKDPETGEYSRSLDITFNLMKGDREDDNEYYTQTLWEDRLYPHLCPITLFLHLAFEDDAFDTIRTPEELFLYTTDREVVTFDFKDEIKNTPLLRSSASCGRDITEDVKAWTYSGCHGALIALAYRVGYRCRVTEYAIRRWAANVLATSVSSFGKIGLMMGHKNPSTIQSSYLRRHSGIDLQNLCQRRAPQTARMRPLHNLASEYFPGMPDLPDSLIEDIKREANQNRDIITLRQNLKQLQLDRASVSLKRVAKSKIDVAIARIKRIARDEFRDHWMKTEGSRYKTVPDPVEEIYVMPPWRADVVELLYNSTELPERRALKLLHCLRKMGTARNGTIQPPKPTYPCPREGCAKHTKPFKTQETLDRHCERVHTRGYHCPDDSCAHHDKPFKTQETLDRHCARVHTRGYHCPDDSCAHHDKPFKTEASLVRHRRQDHEIMTTEYLCPHSNCERSQKPFLSQRNLDNHCNKVHNTQKSTFKCLHDSCAHPRKSFRTARRLSRHWDQVHSPKKIEEYPCTIEGCKRYGIPFRTQGIFERHWRQVHSSTSRSIQAIKGRVEEERVGEGGLGEEMEGVREAISLKRKQHESLDLPDRPSKIPRLLEEYTATVPGFWLLDIETGRQEWVSL